MYCQPCILGEFTLTEDHDLPSHRHNSSAKAHVIGIDEGARIPPSVNSCQIDLRWFSPLPVSWVSLVQGVLLSVLKTKNLKHQGTFFLDATGTSLCD